MFERISWLLLLTVVAGCGIPTAPPPADVNTSPADYLLAEEAGKHLKNLRCLTSGGEDAEAYFSSRGDKLVFQSTRQRHEHDQIYTLDLASGEQQRVSPGPGKTTCAFFCPGDERLVYASTHLQPRAVFKEPNMRKGEAWIFEPSFDVLSCNLSGGEEIRLTDTPGYDAECAASRTTGQIVFCSMRTGDPELFLMDADGKNVNQLTFRKGYDGGPFFSKDGTKIIWRAYYPPTEEDAVAYDRLVKNNIVGRWPFDIWIMNSDGSDKKRITHRGEKESATCWAPYLHPNNRQILFVSSSTQPGQGRPNFDLYCVEVDGSNLERITFSPAFDGFPMFSDNGKQVVFVSSRAATKRGEVSIFLADWVP